MHQLGYLEIDLIFTAVNTRICILKKRLKGMSINETFIQLGYYGIVANVFLRFILMLY